MTKAFQLFLWQNAPSVNTPVGETLLNKVNVALNEVDSRVANMDTTKANQSDMLTAITSVSFDKNTGIFTFTKKNGATTKIDTLLEKLAINFTYDKTNQRLVITNSNGTIQYVDLKALITELEFLNSDTVLFSVTDGKVTANIVKGSITGDMLEPNYLANVQLYADSATKSDNNAKISEENARKYAEQTKKLMMDTENQQNRNFGLIWILYTNDLKMSFSSIELAAQEYAKYDVVVTHILNLNRLDPEIGNSYVYTSSSKEIIKRAKELNPRLKRIEYIQAESERRDFTYKGEYAYLNPDGSWEGSTAQLSGSTRIFTADQIRDWLKFFKSVGADGVFYDDWGYD